MNTAASSATDADVIAFIATHRDEGAPFAPPRRWVIAGGFLDGETTCWIGGRT